jgi:uracil-DNA glycosylase, family 4
MTSCESVAPHVEKFSRFFATAIASSAPSKLCAPRNFFRVRLAARLVAANPCVTSCQAILPRGANSMRASRRRCDMPTPKDVRGATDLPGATPGKQEIDRCRRCELWQSATQGVPGEGPDTATVVLVGEQPGNDEDLAGHPFVGPAGRLLRELLFEADVDLKSVYLTNAVKHFHFEMRGKRRIHKTPTQRHVAACHVWLEQELARLKPRVIVTLGATALVAVLGRKLAITSARTEHFEHAPTGVPVVATYHPSALLRVPDERARDELRALVLQDLRRAARIAARRG